MSVGTQELAFLVPITLFVIVTIAVTKGQWKWLIGIPVCVAIAVLVTPADMLSTFLVAAPYTIGYTYLVLRHEQALCFGMSRQIRERPRLERHRRADRCVSVLAELES